MKKETTSKMSPKAKVAIGVGALAAAAAAYYFFGPDGKSHRKNLKGWMIRMKGEIVERLEKAKDMTETAYSALVDTVASKYSKMVAPEELQTFVADLKKQWKGFSRSSVSKQGSRTSSAPKKKAASKKAAKSARK